MSLIAYKKPSNGFLSEAEERELFISLRDAVKSGNGTEEAKIKNFLATQYALIVSREVTKMGMYNISRDELEAQGLFGLSYAINNFDISRGFRFSTYASKCVRSLLLSYIGKNYGNFDLSKNRNIKKIFFKVRTMLAGLSHKHMTNDLNHAIAQEIANDLGVSKEDVEWVYHQFEKMRHDTTTDNVFGDPSKKSAYVPETCIEAENPEDMLENKQRDRLRKSILEEAMDCLTSREKFIYEVSAFREGEDRMSLGTIGRKFNISGERVRQIRNMAYEKVHARLPEVIVNRGLKLGDIFDISS